MNKVYVFLSCRRDAADYRAKGNAGIATKVIPPHDCPPDSRWGERGDHRQRRAGPRIFT